MSEGTITALEIQKRNKKRVNVYIDGEYAFSLTLDEAATLRKGQKLTESEIARLRDDDAVIRAVDSAARFLSHRPRSEHEVRRNLAEKGTPEPVIEAAIERLRDLGYLDDRAFARFWVQERAAHKPLGTRALRFELRQKGVPDAIVTEVLADVDAEDSAYRAAEAQARRLRGLTRREFKTRLAGFLQRRGFQYGETRDVIARLMETLDSDDPAFFADLEGASNEDEWADD